MLAIGAAEIGGGQKVFLSFVKDLHQRGIRCSVVLPDGPLVEEVRPFAASVHVVNLRSLASVWQIARLIRQQRPSVINTHLTKCGVLFALANLWSRRPLFCTLFNAALHEALTPLARRVYPALYWCLGRLSDGVIVNSEQNKRHLVETTGIPASRIKVIYSGIDIEEFVERAHPRGEDAVFTIGAVGRLATEKGHEFLVRAMAQLRDVPCVCLIAGDGPLRSELEQLAGREGVADRVRFLGFQSNVASVMSDMDVVVMPSLDETFGLTIVEAFALKKLVIASNVGGIPELVRDGDTGLLVPARDAGAIARTIEFAASHPADATRMGRAGHALALQQFTVTAMARHTIDYFAQQTSEVVTS